MLPLIDRSLTQAEWQAFGNDQRRRVGGIRGAAQLFPWLLDAASRADPGGPWGLPPPLRVVSRRIWQPRHARHGHWEPSTPA